MYQFFWCCINWNYNMQGILRSHSSLYILISCSKKKRCCCDRNHTEVSFHFILLSGIITPLIIYSPGNSFWIWCYQAYLSWRSRSCSEFIAFYTSREFLLLCQRSSRCCSFFCCFKISSWTCSEGQFNWDVPVLVI